MRCETTVSSLGVYVLGALDPTERAEVEAHLRDCPSCRHELAELATLPAMLSRLSLDDVVSEQPEVPDDLFDRVAAQARREHDDHQAGSRRNRYRLLAAAAGVIIAGGASVGVALRPHHDGYHGQAGSVHMAVTLDAQTTGTALRVTVSGLPQNEHCQLIAVAKDGSRDVAGRWDATYSGKAQETGSTTIPEADLTRLVLLGTNGKPLVTVPV